VDKTGVPIVNESLQKDEKPPQDSKEEKVMETEDDNTKQDTQTHVEDTKVK
jgi:hypothetical protein